MDAEQRKQLGRRIAAARKERGWSQAKLAEEAGQAENTISSMESGARNTQDAKLRAVLDVLNLTTRSEGIIQVEGLQEDARVYLTVAAKRLHAMEDDNQRARKLNRLYEALLDEED